MVNVLNSFVSTPMDGGTFFSADLGTDLPEDALEELAAEFLAGEHGAIDENGIGKNIARTTTVIRAHGGKPFRTVQTEYTERYVITLLEDDNENVLKTVFGDANVTITTANEDGVQKTIYHSSEPLPIKSYVIQSKDGEKIKREVVERGQVIEVGEIRDTHSDVTKYQVTLETYEAAEGNPANVKEYRNDASQAIEP